MEDHILEEYPEKEKPQRSPFMSVLLGFIDFVKTVALIVLIAFGIRVFAIQPFIVEGESMEPNFQNNDYLITEKIVYRFKEPARGDIVIFKPPDSPQVNYIKRIIGLPGETVEIKKDGIYVNNQPLAEQYLVRSYESHELKPAAKVSLGANEYYVMGDNRDHSRDSRELGPIPRQNIVSHVWFRLLPPKSARVFAHINYQIAP